MDSKTIVLVEKDRVGLIKDIVTLLENKGVSINSINVNLVTDKTFIYLGLSDPVKGTKLLIGAGYCIRVPKGRTSLEI